MGRTSIVPLARMLALVILTAALLPLATSAASDDAQTWMVQAGTDTGNHAIQDLVFLPKEIWIHQGDTIAWNAHSGEPHTVTFLAPGQTLPSFDAILPCGLEQDPNPTFDNQTFATCTTGTGSTISYLNSGLLTTLPAALPFPSYASYQLQFAVTGSFAYYCLIHPGMQGTVHVLNPSDALPYTQAGYNAQAALQGQRLIDQGQLLRAKAAQLASNTDVTAGTGTTEVDVMRFIYPTQTIHVGQSITFANRSAQTPHTFTIGAEQCPNGNCQYGDPTNYLGGPLNSGWFFGDQSFKVTFNQAGTYPYYCALHDFLGMKGTVVVLP